ncbi:hypothetical protein ENBRE01_2372 [Enteropsectra breve]|nr:hypothetical protein ENBRE01_2372 [Enteropsectra breve]
MIDHVNKMRGTDNEKTNSEEPQEEATKTETATINLTQETEETKTLADTAQCTNKLIILKAITNSCQAESNKWPEEILKSISERFDRMPRGGWEQCYDEYCTKFSTQMSLNEFKAKLQNLSHHLVEKHAQGKNIDQKQKKDLN